MRKLARYWELDTHMHTQFFREGDGEFQEFFIRRPAIGSVRAELVGEDDNHWIVKSEFPTTSKVFTLPKGKPEHNFAPKARRI
jgi:hypothetical protein